MVQKTGLVIDAAGVNHGWYKFKGHFTVLDYPSSTGTQALGLNNTGLVVGSWTDSSGNSHGFTYNTSTAVFTSVDDPDGIGTTIVNGINDNGTVVGFYGTAPINSGFVATVAHGRLRFSLGTFGANAVCPPNYLTPEVVEFVRARMPQRSAGPRLILICPAACKRFSDSTSLDHLNCAADSLPVPVHKKRRSLSRPPVATAIVGCFRS